MSQPSDIAIDQHNYFMSNGVCLKQALNQTETHALTCEPLFKKKTSWNFPLGFWRTQTLSDGFLKHFKL